MVEKTYISKYCTIISDCELNTGLNPVSELVYGKGLVHSRALLYFDHSKVKSLVDGGIMPDISKLTHRLHVTNSASLDFSQLHDCNVSSISDCYKIRAVSFDLIFFLIPAEWDCGKGFDYKRAFANKDPYDKVNMDETRLTSTDGCNWFQRRNGYPWDEDGVYSNDTLSKEYDKFSEKTNSSEIVIARQKFEFGNESIDIDITDVMNKFITGDLKNYGIGIAFSPLLELTDSEWENYIGFLTNRTNTWYEPYVETRYNDRISDDRNSFALDKENKLYLYCNIGSTFDDLDSNPLVTIRDDEENIITDADGNLIEAVEAQKYSKGIYYLPLRLSSSDFEADRMLYDTWDGLVYHGAKLSPAELDFTLKSPSMYFGIGKSLPNDPTFSVTVTGIQEREKIVRGDVRRLSIVTKPSYSTNVTQLIDTVDIRVYVMDGLSEIDFISWDGVNRSDTESFYIVDTGMFIPQRYYVDIRIRYGMSSIIHHDVLSFDIVNDKTHKIW